MQLLLLRELSFVFSTWRGLNPRRFLVQLGILYRCSLKKQHVHPEIKEYAELTHQSLTRLQLGLGKGIKSCIMASSRLGKSNSWGNYLIVVTPIAKTLTLIRIGLAFCMILPLRWSASSIHLQRFTYEWWCCYAIRVEGCNFCFGTENSGVIVKTIIFFLICAINRSNNL